jgi:antitoxin ParD1/3/4
MTLEISLSPKIEEMVRSKIARGLYGSETELVQEALLLLNDYDQIREQRVKSLREAIEEARASGPSIPAEEVFADLRKEFEVVRD